MREKLMRSVNEHLETTADGYQRWLNGYELFRLGVWQFGYFKSTLYEKGSKKTIVSFRRKVGSPV